MSWYSEMYSLIARQTAASKKNTKFNQRHSKTYLLKLNIKTFMIAERLFSTALIWAKYPVMQ